MKYERMSRAKFAHWPRLQYLIMATFVQIRRDGLQAAQHLADNAIVQIS